MILGINGDGRKGGREGGEGRGKQGGGMSVPATMVSAPALAKDLVLYTCN